MGLDINGVLACQNPAQAYAIYDYIRSKCVFGQGPAVGFHGYLEHFYQFSDWFIFCYYGRNYRISDIGEMADEEGKSFIFKDVLCFEDTYEDSSIYRVYSESATFQELEIICDYWDSYDNICSNEKITLIPEPIRDIVLAYFMRKSAEFKSYMEERGAQSLYDSSDA